MNILVPYGRMESMGHREWLESVADQSVLQPFAPVVIEFADRMSKRILLDRKMRIYPEMMALAHWLRKAHVYELKRVFEDQTKGRVTRPRGLVLHFAPSNVDTIFVYSFMLSLFCGNSNIVRVSGKPNSQLDELLRILNDLLLQEEFQSLQERICILTYEHDRAVTEWLSSLCSVRIIWGGDHTVKDIRSIPLPPLATELTFADRFSFAVLSAEEVAGLSDDSLEELAQRFYNDCYWFQQMACSSPRLVFWAGQENQIQVAKQRFWVTLDRVLAAKASDLQPALYINLLTTAYHYATMNSVKEVNIQRNGLPARIQADSLDTSMRESHCGGGLFLEINIRRLEDMLPWLQPKDQTMTYFGFDLDALNLFISAIPGRQIDRIVPIGKALEFSYLWDGINFFTQLTRNVNVIY